MKPMDRDFINEHDIAQRYLHGRLTPEEAEEFEVYLMDNPEMVEELELSQLFNQKLCNVSPSASSSKFAWFKPVLTHVGSGLATAALCLVVFFQYLPANIGPQISAGTLQEVVFESDVRSINSADVKEMSISSQSDFVVLRMPVSANFQIEHKIDALVVNAKTSTPVIKLDGLDVSEYGEVSLVLPFDQVKDSRLHIKLFNSETKILDNEFLLNSEQK